MKKLSVVQDTIDSCLAQITSREQLLPLILTRAASRRNLSLSELDIQLLTAALLNAQGSVIQLDLGSPCSLGANEEEIQAALQGLVDEIGESVSDIGDSVVESITQAIPDVLAKVAALLGDRISEQALEHTLHMRKAHSDRAEKVQRLWGSALEQLDFLRHIVLEWDCTAKELRCGSYANPNTAFALNKLVARAYEIVGEIITLARAGYADGSLARWRSLHEVCVIAMFLAKKSDKCSRMYLLHHQIEELRLLETDRASGTARTTNPDHAHYARNLRKQKAAMVSKFGAAYAKDYGWASVELGRAKTTFRDLENHVELETLRRGYQQANSTIHGGALAALTRISLGPGSVDSSEAPLAYGCEVATNYAAASLSMLVAELCLETENADLITMSMVVHNYSAEIHEEIKRSQRKVSDDTPRKKILMRKAEQRALKTKARRVL